MGFIAAAYQDLLLTAQRQTYETLIFDLSNQENQRQTTVSQLSMELSGNPVTGQSQQNPGIQAEVDALNSQIKLIEQNLELYQALRQAVVTEIESVRKVLDQVIKDSFKTFDNSGGGG